jgi:hypothetical protein
LLKHCRTTYVSHICCSELTDLLAIAEFSLHSVTLKIWLAASGKYSSASPYKAFFHGTVEVDYERALLKNMAPLKEKVFWPLALRDHCDRF